MGFLSKSSAPSELPDLAIESLGRSAPIESARQYTQPIVSQPLPILPKPIIIPQSQKKEVVREDCLEFSRDAIQDKPAHDDIKKAIDNNLLRASESGKLSKSGFFDQVLNDINGEIKDLGNLEDWYEKKFLKQDVVSNMKGYWEENKADIIIESFGAEYKRQINDKVKILQELEEDWREIYFRLVKKEEEMKKEERELKETLSEFVNLCKRKKGGDEK